LVVTITRSSLLSPRIRYNVHDEGGVARYDELAMVLASVGFDIRKLAGGQSGERPLKFPFLWVYGRRDYTISVMGANIYPEDLEQCLYADRELARLTRSYCLSLYESPEEGVRPFFLFEIEGEPSEELTRRFSESILQHLLELNADFREAWREYPETMVPKIQLYGLGQGPFKKQDLRIKQIRFLRKI
jgi:phenylacetate-CoA ligase